MRLVVAYVDAIRAGAVGQGVEDVTANAAALREDIASMGRILGARDGEPVHEAALRVAEERDRLAERVRHEHAQRLALEATLTGWREGAELARGFTAREIGHYRERARALYDALQAHLMTRLAGDGPEGAEDPERPLNRVWECLACGATVDNADGSGADHVEPCPLEGGRP